MANKYENSDKVTYIKLKDGTWGLRGGKTLIREGEKVTVHLKNGSTKEEVVEKVLWWDDEVALASIVTVKNRHLAEPNTKIQD